MSLKPPTTGNPGINGNTDGYTSGTAPVWTGAGFTPTDIASQVELNTHAALTTGAHGGIVATTDSRLPLSVKSFGAVGNGSTDDSTAFASAMTALSTAGGGTLVIPSGTYVINTAFSVPSNTYIVGMGQPTLKVKASSTSNPLLLASASTTDVTVEGVTFDGNRSNITSGNNLVTVAPATRFRFVRCVFTNTRGFTIVFGGTGGCQQSGVLFSRFYDCGTLNRTTGDPNDRHQAISFSGGGSRNYVNFCDFQTIGLDCISFAGGETQCEAIGNTISDTTAGSIYVSTSSLFRVAHNYISNGSGGGNGIDTHNATNGEITGNVCIGNGAAGILIAGDERVSVTGNVCVNNWQSGTSGHRGGITFDSSEAGATTGHVTLTGNVCMDTQGATTTQLYGIGIVTGSGTLDRDSIKVDDSNVLRGYASGGAVSFTNRFQTGDLGAVGAVLIVAVAANATFTVSDASRLMWVDVADLNATHVARFFVNQTVLRAVYDTGTLWATTDTGTNNAIFSSGGSILIRNRTAGSRTYAITVFDKVRMA